MDTILILGSGKMATALMLTYRSHAHIIQCTRKDFDALQPASVDALIITYQPKIVYNTVVFGGIDACYENSTHALTVNTLFPAHLAKLSQQYDFKLIHFSTDAVFADTKVDEYCYENTLPKPPNMYGLTKYGADCFIPQYTDNYLIFRLPLLFGPTPKKNQFLEKMLELGIKNKRLQISKNIFSRPVYSMDVALFIINGCLQLPKGLYHIYGEEIASLYDLMREACHCLNLDIHVEPVNASVFATKDIKNLYVAMHSHFLMPLRSYKDGLKNYQGDSVLFKTKINRSG